MPDLKVSCPTTGKQIGGGIEIDEKTLNRIRPYLLRVACPHCGKTHELALHDARLDAAA